jgi:hypothetical protein
LTARSRIANAAPPTIDATQVSSSVLQVRGTWSAEFDGVDVIARMLARTKTMPTDCRPLGGSPATVAAVVGTSADPHAISGAVRLIAPAAKLA